MKITFLGAAGEVTGSQHLIETSSRRILLDCGFFQGTRAEARRKNYELHCGPESLDAVIISHGHMDHCGNLPRLYKLGFRGPVFCTPSTLDIMELMLLDSAKIQEEDAKYLTKKLKGNGPPVDPLYTLEDVQEVMKLVEPVPFDEWNELGEGNEVNLRFLPAGHILGSAITELELWEDGEMKRIVYTGDLGRRNTPLLIEPAIIRRGADAVICESTYGNRTHPPADTVRDTLLRVFCRAEETGGRVIIPSFALGRTQAITYYLNDLHHKGLLPDIPIFVDSPLAIRLTKLYKHHVGEIDIDVQDTMRYDTTPFEFPAVSYVHNQKDSIALNSLTGPLAIIAGSGMCESGRIVHHLKHGIGNPNNTILLMGYQAPNTLGRKLAEKQKYVRIFSEEFQVEAQVEQVHGLSAHADAEDIKWWFHESAKHSNFVQTFLVHGEPEVAECLRDLIRNEVDEEPIIPRYGESYEIEGGPL